MFSATPEERSALSPTLVCATKEDFEFDPFLQQFGIVAAVIWQRGQPMLVERVHPDSGFRVALGEHHHPEDMFVEIMGFLEHYPGMFDALQRLKAEARIDILVPLVAPEVVARCINFPVNLLRCAGSLNVGLGITACLVEGG